MNGIRQACALMQSSVFGWRPQTHQTYIDPPQKETRLFPAGLWKFGRGCLKGTFLLCDAALFCKCEISGTGCVKHMSRQGGASQAPSSRHIRASYL